MQIEPELQHVADRLKAHFENEGWLLEQEPVEYGVKLTLDAGDTSAAGTLYFSKKKKRFSWVPNGKGDKQLAAELAEAVHERIGGENAGSDSGRGSKYAASAEELGLKVWIGSDEAGKGDLFGPIVVGAFLADREIANDLAKRGVRDSKQLKRPAIESIARGLHAAYKDRIAIVEVGPKRYNEMYDGFERRGGINGLLGWAHAKAIEELAFMKPEIEAAVVDRFSKQPRVTPHLPKDLKTTLRVLERPGGESNLAVAAGAILARDRFEQALDRIGSELGWRPHAGSGSAAVEDLEKLAVDRRAELNHFVKAHFGPVKSRRLL